jgi:hypothetical protein
VASSTHDVLGAVRPAAKTVPAEAYAEEGASSGGGDVEVVVEDPQPEEVVEGPLPPVGEPPEEVSEDTRKTQSKENPRSRFRGRVQHSHADTPSGTYMV